MLTSRKLIAGLMCVLSLILLFSIGCSAKRPESDLPEAVSAPRTDDEFYVVDIDPALGNVWNDANIAETENTIYILDQDAGVVWFSDKDYKCFMPLCARPDCHHDSEDCSAYIGSRTMSLYGRWLYFVKNYYVERGSAVFPELWRMKLDGSDHEKVIDIPMPIEEGERRLYSIRCEGKAVNKYVLLTVGGARPSQSIDDDVVESFRGVYSIDLETMKIVQIDLPQSPDDSINPLVNNGNKLYAITSHSEDLVTISEIDLTWGVSRVLYVGKYGVNYTSRGYYLSGDTLYYVEFINDGDLYDRIRTLYSLNVVTCERKMIRQERNADAAWLTFDSYSGYNYAERDKLEEDPAKRGIYINDMDLDLLEFIPFSELPDEAGGKLKPSYITHDYIFGAGAKFEGLSYVYTTCSGIPVWYLDKSEIGSGHMQWHRWEPDG